jgi:hypothetical protein
MGVVRTLRKVTVPVVPATLRSGPVEIALFANPCLYVGGHGKCLNLLARLINHARAAPQRCAMRLERNTWSQMALVTPYWPLPAA